jgi:hypothetical protein
MDGNSNVSFPAPTDSKDRLKTTPARPNLIYLICFDAPKSESNRYLAKMLVSSLLRTYFTGDIVVFRNSPNPLFLVERKGLEEVYLDTPQLSGMTGAEDAWCWKYRVAAMLDVTSYDKVLFLDADMLALRNIDHWDIAYQPTRDHDLLQDSFAAFWTPAETAEYRTAIQESHRRQQSSFQNPISAIKHSIPPHLTGINSGSMAFRASLFHEILAEWRRIDESERRVELGFRDQASWNALLMRNTTKGGKRKEGEGNGRWTAQPFAEGEIQFPMFLDPSYHCYTKAALTHNCGGDTLVKI